MLKRDTARVGVRVPRWNDLRSPAQVRPAVAIHQAREPYLVRVMSRRQTITYAVLISFWLAADVFFWIWWLQAGHRVTTLGLVANSLLLAWTTWIPGWFFFLVARMKRPNPALPIPAGRVAMVVTKAPSEPWPVVRETLQAMLRQRFPYRYDVWLADEDPSEETTRWCAEHGVRISCRKDVPGYHNTSWPRRARCKEGNLAYFYDTYGYANYDFVSQLDADHVPEPDYLANIIRPFADPAVGYVAAPSICDKNIDESWVVRGRAYLEAPFHGPQQAGFNEGFAPVCIGSHYAVRTTALRDIGGLGPELAEDFSTTLMMNASGWKGVFSIDAIAHGDGPGSATDSVVQEFQWARSLVTILLTVTSRYWSRLSLGLKLQFAFVQLWYPLVGVYMLTACVLFPFTALVTKTPWVSVTLHDFILHAVAIDGSALVIIWWLRRQDWMRPRDIGLVAWQPILVQLIRWPWLLWAVAHAVVGWIGRRVFSFKVTPKGVSMLKPLPMKILLPYGVISMAGALISWLIPDAGNANGYHVFALLTAVIYFGVLIVVVGLHVAENRRYVTSPRPFLGASFTALLLLPLVLAACASQFPDVTSVLKPTPTETPLVSLATPSSMPGVLPSDAILFGAFDPNSRLVLPPGSISGTYFAWGSESNPSVAQALDATVRRQQIPLLSIEPWPLAGIGTAETLFTDITSGKYDDGINQLCTTAGSVAPRPVLLRWGHEMELVGHYPWSRENAAEFTAAYRHFVTTCRHPNIQFVWSPAGHADLGDYWPGSDYVDYVGLTTLNVEEWSIAQGASRGPTFVELFAPRYALVEQYQKPVIIAEFGAASTEDEQTTWLEAARESFANYPLLRAVVYFEATDIRPWGDAIYPNWEISQQQYDRLSSPTSPGGDSTE